MTKGRLKCRLRLSFFGLNEIYLENVYEQYFQLKYHGQWSFVEAYNLPIGLRNWFYKRLLKQKEDEKPKSKKKDSKYPYTNPVP